MATNSEVHRGSGQYLFICYSHQDVSLVEQEAEWLRRQGFRLWYDDNIAAGHAWSEELAEAIAGCSAVLYFLSAHSASSAYCVDELHFAKERKIPLVPIEVEKLELSPGLQLTLGSHQFIRMVGVGRKEFRNRLAAGLSAILAGSSTATSAGATVDTANPAVPRMRLMRARLAGAAAAVLTLGLVLLVD